MSKPAFNEEFVSQHQDPLAPTHEEFDYDAVSRALGEPIEDDEREPITITPEAIAVVGRILRFCLNLKGSPANKNTQLIFGRRLAALAWVMNPAFFDDSPSLRELAKRIGINFPSNFAMHTADASREFGITNRAQDHAWNRKSA